MLNKQAIYHKTTRGAQAIANRQSGLGPRLRSLLIVIDGKRSFVDLCALIGECEALLLHLAQEGLVEPVAGNAPAATETLGVATAPDPLAAVSLTAAKRLTSRLLLDVLGPTSEMLCLKIESAGNLADFVTAVKRARDVVHDIKGAAAAQRFIAQVEPHTPASY